MTTTTPTGTTDPAALLERAAGIIASVRSEAPLVHCPSASVTMLFVANGLLAAGARPMMTWSEAEAPALTGGADALLANLGVLALDGPRTLPQCVTVAREAGRPWVLDPAAIGAAPVRTPLAETLLDEGPTAIRANASEILHLARGSAAGRGADAHDEPEAALPAGIALARRTGAVVAVSGAEDLLTDGERVVRSRRGHPLLTRVTGTGCLLGALVAACLARSGGDALAATLAATAWMTLAAESAARTATGPGTFSPHLLDALARLDPTDVAAAEGIRVTRPTSRGDA